MILQFFFLECPACLPFNPSLKLSTFQLPATMPQLPTSQPSERRPSQRWIWFSLLGLMLLCAAAIHRRQLPLQRSKDLSGYKYIYLSPAAENLDQLADMNDDNDDKEDDDNSNNNEESVFADVVDDPLEIDTTRRLNRRRAVSRLQATVKRAQFQEWEH